MHTPTHARTRARTRVHTRAHVWCTQCIHIVRPTLCVCLFQCQPRPPAPQVQELLLEKDRLALQVAELHAQAQACVAATEASAAQRAQWEEDRRRADRLDEEVKRVSAELTEARSGPAWPSGGPAVGGGGL